MLKVVVWNICCFRQTWFCKTSSFHFLWFYDHFSILCFAWAGKRTKSFKAKTGLHRCTCPDRSAYLRKINFWSLLKNCRFQTGFRCLMSLYLATFIEAFLSHIESTLLVDEERSRLLLTSASAMRWPSSLSHVSYLNHSWNFMFISLW